MKKVFKKNIAIFICFTMVFNCFFSVLANESVESSEPETTYTETIEPTNIEDITENIEEFESDEKESDSEVSDEDSYEIEAPQEDEEEIGEEAEEEVVEEEALDDSSEEIIEPEGDNEDIEDVYEEEPEEERDEDIEEVDIASPSDTEEVEEETEEEIEEATPSNAEEVVEEGIINDATPSETEEIIDVKCEIKIYFITDMKLKDKGNGGSYNYSWDTFIVDKNQEFNIDEKIPEVIKHSSCEQEYTLVGFTTENQINSIWKGADYAGGVPTLAKNFMVDSDTEIFAVYEAKDIYISSITIDNEITYKTTTIPNKAIKNILISDNKDEIYNKNDNVKYYKIKNNLDDINYMFTKDSSEGKPIKLDDFSLENYKK